MSERSVLDLEVGPFYNVAGVAGLLGVTESDVAARRREHTILAVETADHHVVVPVFQFAGNQVDPALIPAIQAFAGAPPWSSALWFVTENDALDDMTRDCCTLG